MLHLIIAKTACVDIIGGTFKNLVEICSPFFVDGDFKSLVFQCLTICTAMCVFKLILAMHELVISCCISR